MHRKYDKKYKDDGVLAQFCILSKSDISQVTTHFIKINLNIFKEARWYWDTHGVAEISQQKNLAFIIKKWILSKEENCNWVYYHETNERHGEKIIISVVQFVFAFQLSCQKNLYALTH